MPVKTRWISLLFLVSFVARAELVDRIAAIVNNDIVTLSEVEARIAPDLQRLRSEPDANRRSELRAELTKRALDLIIGEKLMEAQAKELNIEVTDTEVEAAMEDVIKQNNKTKDEFELLLAEAGYSMPSYKAFMRKHIAQMKLINLKVRAKVKVSDEDLKAEYARWSHDEATEYEVHARQILVSVGPKATPEEVELAHQKALMLMQEAREPGVDFAELARKKSEGSSSADGGDLGFFRRGVMMADFERVAFGTPVGEVAEPVRTKFGWHVIKVEEKRALAAPPFDEVKDQLRQKMMLAQQEKYTDQYVQELRAAAVVDVKI